MRQLRIRVVISIAQPAFSSRFRLRREGEKYYSNRGGGSHQGSDTNLTTFWISTLKTFQPDNKGRGRIVHEELRFLSLSKDDSRFSILDSRFSIRDSGLFLSMREYGQNEHEPVGRGFCF